MLSRQNGDNGRTCRGLLGLAKLALERTTMHAQFSCCLRDVAATFANDAVNVGALGFVKRRVRSGLGRFVAPGFHGGDDRVDRCGLLNVVVSAELHRGYRRRYGRARSQQDDSRPGHVVFKVVDDLEPGMVADEEVEKDDLGSLGSRGGDCAENIVSRNDAPTTSFEFSTERAKEYRIVVDDQYNPEGDIAPRLYPRH
jgi:hypothetical protein